jgi:D-beta-D-heptose 7-phosphate kinase/D-beta-D-heptose 1-phosphate adenosyltransferase
VKILVIGESCKDVFKYGKCERLDPAAPAIVYCPLETKENGGMAMNVFNNIKSLGADVEIHTNQNWTIVTKTRFVDKKTNYILLREDNNDNQYGNCDLKLIDFEKYDAIVISDYNKGFLSRLDIKEICKKHPLVFLDTKKEIGKWCECVNFIKINNYEVSKARQVTKTLKDRLVITLGPAGASHKNTIYPVSSVDIKDLSGAGDTFMSGLVYKYTQTKDIDKAINFANECATVVVQRAGVVTV